MTEPNIQTRDEALALLALPQEELFQRANEIREAVFGDTIDLCAIINARSGNCTMDCAFCSQSQKNPSPIPQHPLLTREELLHRIHTLAQLPVAHIGIVTSGGKLSDHEVNTLCSVLEALPPHTTSRICASLGRLTLGNLEKLASAGLTRYHHNIECSASFYPNICTTQRWQDRLVTVLHAREAGLTNCTGGLFGMGESWIDRIDMALTLKAHAIAHIPMNFLYPHKNTPLEHRPPLRPNEAQTIIAVFRHILPRATLRICGGRPTTFPEHQERIFTSGANALMVGDYLTTKGASTALDLSLLKQMGLKSSFVPA